MEKKRRNNSLMRNCGIFRSTKNTEIPHLRVESENLQQSSFELKGTKIATTANSSLYMNFESVKSYHTPSRVSKRIVKRVKTSTEPKIPPKEIIVNEEFKVEYIPSKNPKISYTDLWIEQIHFMQRTNMMDRSAERRGGKEFRTGCGWRWGRG